MWALVIYSLLFLGPDGSPEVMTFHPLYSEAECRVLQRDEMPKLLAAGYAGRCQYFPENSTPHWSSGR